MELTTILGIYMGFGVLFTVLEHFTYDWSELDDMPLSAVVLNMLQQTIHYSRFVLTWPSYLAEDLLVMLMNRINEDGDYDD